VILLFNGYWIKAFVYINIYHMNSKHLKYLLGYINVAIIGLSIYLGGVWSFLALAYVFILIPLAELFLTGSQINMDKQEEEIARRDRIYDFLVYSAVPFQFGLIVFFLFRVSDPSLALWEKIGMMTALGISCGALGINAGHELGHRISWYEQLMAKMLLSTAQYMHFFIEHNRGHHKNVSTDKDPASGRYGESLYAFYIRSVSQGWLSAWHLESDRLKKAGQGFWSIHNEMLCYQFIQAGILIAIDLLFGWQTMLLYLGAAVLGFLMLETVNYIEHYGLRRKKTDGDYEKTMPIHSWNSDHTIGRIFLLEVTRHSDHHYMPNRKYQVLRHFDESPQLPTGYPGMMVLALIPPLWFKVMHRQIENYRATPAGAALG
jgi:alkane 1-monooxygenase